MRRSPLLLPLLFALVVGGCYAYPSGGPTPDEDRACVSHADCKGGRLCVDGACEGEVTGEGGGGGGGSGGGGGVQPCVGDELSCGCAPFGFQDGLSELRFFSCDRTRGTTIAGDDVTVADVNRVCFGTLQPCERAGLEPLLDAGFLSCGATRAACEGADELFGWIACRASDGLCVSSPWDGAGQLCGELELQTAVSTIRDRILREDNCATP